MKLVIMRGLPGTGKSTLADRLGERTGYDVIHVDAFKLEAMNRFRDMPVAAARQESRNQSYDRTMQELYSLYESQKPGVIVEELLCDKTFVERIKDFARKPNIIPYCFRVERPMADLLDVESKRLRGVKNSYQDFMNLQEDMDSNPLDSEMPIENNDIEQALQQILRKISD